MTKIRRIGLENAARFAKPGARERVIFAKARELVPIVVDGVDHALVGTRQGAFKLEIVRRVGENEIDACVGKLAQAFDAVANQNLIKRQALRSGWNAAGRNPVTRDLNTGFRAGRSGSCNTHGH